MAPKCNSSRLKHVIAEVLQRWRQAYSYKAWMLMLCLLAKIVFKHLNCSTCSGLGCLEGGLSEHVQAPFDKMHKLVLCRWLGAFVRLTMAAS